MAGNSHNLVELTKKQQEQALARFEQIRPYFEEGVSQAELARLRREVIKLEAERDILKKAAAYFAKEAL